MSPRDPFFTAANLLSLVRLPLGAAFAVALSAPWGGRWAAMGVLALAGASDVADGWSARRAWAARAASGLAEGAPAKERASPAGMGSWLDPICDKLFVASVLGAIWYASHPPLWWLGLIVARELIQLPLSLIYAAIPALRRWLRYDFRASAPGKAATVMQFCAVAALIWQSRAALGFGVASFVIGLVALGDYLRRAIRIGARRLDGGRS
jgi:phosphatidylglycerophosphate synthase